MRIALIADIHSNYPALQVTLADIDRMGVDATFVVGDAVNGGAFPLEVLGEIYSRDLPLVRGNHEQYLLDYPLHPAQFPLPQWNPVAWTVNQLSASDMAFIAQTPPYLMLEDVLLTHAAPHDMNKGIIPSTPDSTLATYFGAVTQRVIVTAHTHLPLVVHWRDKLLINPGSVGIPLDGVAAASYALLTQTASGWAVQHRRVPYDVDYLARESAARGFIEEGGMVALMLLREQMHGRMFVIPYLREVFAIMRQTKLSFAEASLHVSDAQPDTRYGLLDWT